MIVKFTLIGLIVLLIIVIATSYYDNKEGFDDITNIPTSLESAINTVLPDQKASEDSTVPKRNDVIPEVSISGTGYEAMSLHQRMDLLKDIQKIVRNEILANRNTKPIISGETRKTSETDSTAQGKEYENNCPKSDEQRCPKNPDGSCPPLPDMSQYIKKDAIPCWGCSLDY